MTFLIIIYFFSVLVIFLTSLFLINFYINIIRSFLKPTAPYVPVPSESLEKIAKNILVNENSLIYDLGSGDGRLLSYLNNFYKKGNYVGVERNLYPYIVSKFKCRKQKNIKFILEDFYKTNISKANILVLYLFPQVLDMLLPKFDKELSFGTIVYSVDFQFSNKKPEKSIYLGPNKTGRGEKLFVYKF